MTRVVQRGVDGEEVEVGVAQPLSPTLAHESAPSADHLIRPPDAEIEQSDA
jgi:hypothetical protein